ncbi:MAG TPA: DUF5777 family beta-barrel protein [Chitinophagaceae bacterium]
MRKTIITTILIIVSYALHAQEESLLDSLLPEKPQKEFITNAFKSSRVINGHSMELIGRGVLDFRILHRFGKINQGIGELFGLDQASMRMGFDYGLGKNITVGIGRTTFRKELDGFLKWRLIRQAKGGSPFSLVVVGGTSIYTFKNTDPLKVISFSSRIGYYYQLIAGRKFSERFSMQLSPTLVHRNEVTADEANDTYALGIGTRFKLSKRTALVIDYYPVLNRPANSTNKDPLSIGFDFETGGHVFQLHFSNATGMNERAFITDTQESWGEGGIRFGFNLSRVFTVAKRRFKTANVTN